MLFVGTVVANWTKREKGIRFGGGRERRGIWRAATSSVCVEEWERVIERERERDPCVCL